MVPRLSVVSLPGCGTKSGDTEGHGLPEGASRLRPVAAPAALTARSLPRRPRVGGGNDWRLRTGV